MNESSSINGHSSFIWLWVEAPVFDYFCRRLIVEPLRAWSHISHNTIKGETEQCFMTSCSVLTCPVSPLPAGLLSHDADNDDKPKKPYNPPNWFGGDESKRYKHQSHRNHTWGHKHEVPVLFVFWQILFIQSKGLNFQPHIRWRENMDFF